MDKKDSKPVSRPRRRIHPAALAGVGVAVISILLIALWGFLEFQSRGELKDYLAGVESRGYAIRYNDAAPPAAGPENAAKAWRDLLESDMPTVLPIVTSRPLSSLKLLTPDELETLAEAFANHGELLATLARIAELPAYAFTPSEAAKLVYEHIEPPLRGVIKLYRTLFASCMALAKLGRADEAIELWLLGLRSSRHFLGSPLGMWSVDVGKAVREQALFAAPYVFGGGQYDRETLDEAIRALDTRPWRDGLIRALDLERLWILEAGVIVTSTERGLARELFASDERVNSYAGRLAVGAFAPWMRAELIRLNEGGLALIERFKADPRNETGTIATWIDAQDFAPRKTSWRPTRFLSSWLAPFSRTSLVDSIVRAAGQSELVRLLLACEAYRLEHGRRPENLSSLVPEFIDAVGSPFVSPEKILYYLDESGGEIRIARVARRPASSRSLPDAVSFDAEGWEWIER